MLLPLIQLFPIFYSDPDSKLKKNYFEETSKGFKGKSELKT